MNNLSHRRSTRIKVFSVLLLAATVATACGSDGGDAKADPTTAAPSGSTGSETTAGATDTTAASTPGSLNLTADQNRIVPAKVDEIAAKVPEAIRKSGKLRIGVGAAGSGFPPLAFAADDNTTLIGSEPDFAVLIAGVLGLEPDFSNTSWEDMWVGIDSGKYDIAVSNITVTELRKEKYDFATYRQDNLAFEAPADADWTFTKPEDLAGKTIAVGSGTNQEKILLDYAEQVKAAGLKPITVKYFQDNNSLYLALQSGQIDASFGPNPSIAYHVSTSGETKIIGQVSGAGDTLQGLIAALTPKDSGLVEALADALNYVIESGDYEKVLERWNLTNEAVGTSEINPPGLPK